jgi:transposase-like protein
MGKHYSKEIKLEAVRLFREGKSHGEISAALGIRDKQRTKKWVRAYREQGADAFQKNSKKGKGGRRPKKTNPQAYVARLEMENALLKKFHTELRKRELAQRNIGRSTITERTSR